MKNKCFLLLVGFFTYITINAQFDEAVSKFKLYDDALDMGVYLQMLAKDKLYIIKNLKKKQASKEIDYALAKINDNLNEIDLEENNPQIRQHIDKIKDFIIKFDSKFTATKSVQDFSSLYFEINVFDKMISDMSETMFEVYDFDNSKIQNYKDIQALRKLIQIISLSYYANILNLNKSFKHNYTKNIEKINNFIAQKSNTFLNDPIIGKYFPDFISDWNFFKANLQSEKYKNPKTIFSMSVSIEYLLKKIKDAYFKKLNMKF